MSRAWRRNAWTPSRWAAKASTPRPSCGAMQCCHCWGAVAALRAGSGFAPAHTAPAGARRGGGPRPLPAPCGVRRAAGEAVWGIAGGGAGGDPSGPRRPTIRCAAPGGTVLAWHCGCSGYWPLRIFCGKHLLGSRLRPADRVASAGSLAELLRGWGSCAAAGPAHGSTSRLTRGSAASPSCGGAKRAPAARGWVERAMRGWSGPWTPSCSKRETGSTARAARRCRDCTYRAHGSWSRCRQVAGQAEHLAQEPHPRFARTHLPPGRGLGPAAARKAPWRTRGAGGPDPGAAAQSVRRPHQRPSAAGAPAALVLLSLGLGAATGPAGGWVPGACSRPAPGAPCCG